MGTGQLIQKKDTQFMRVFFVFSFTILDLGEIDEIRGVEGAVPARRTHWYVERVRIPKATKKLAISTSPVSRRR